MKNNLYVLFNKLAMRYGDVVNYPTDSFAVNRLTKIMEKPESGLIKEETILFKVGSIDLENGLMDALPAPIPVPWEVTNTVEVNND